jgi:rubrerythrin
MSPESKRHLLASFDALSAIESGRAAGHGKGNTAACDHCGYLLASGRPHPVTCPIGGALAMIRPEVPAYQDRAKWLGEP